MNKYRVVFLDEDGFEEETTLQFQNSQELFEELSMDGVEVILVEKVGVVGND